MGSQNGLLSTSNHLRTGPVSPEHRRRVPAPYLELSRGHWRPAAAAAPGLILVEGGRPTACANLQLTQLEGEEVPGLISAPVPSSPSAGTSGPMRGSFPTDCEAPGRPEAAQTPVFTQPCSPACLHQSRGLRSRNGTESRVPTPRLDDSVALYWVVHPASSVASSPEELQIQLLLPLPAPALRNHTPVSLCPHTHPLLFFIVRQENATKGTRFDDPNF